MSSPPRVRVSGWVVFVVALVWGGAFRATDRNSAAHHDNLGNVPRPGVVVKRQARREQASE